MKTTVKKIYKYSHIMSLCFNKRSVLLCGTMLILICFTLFIAFRNADAASTNKLARADSTTNLKLVYAVCILYYKNNYYKN